MGIFISYSHRDTEKVNRIVRLLNEHSNNTVWVDARLRGGDQYFSVIAEQILKNEFFVFVVSDSSIQSDWCIRELQFAMSEGRKIIAVWLDDVDLPPVIKFIIHNTHYLNWSPDEDDFASNIERCFSDVISGAPTVSQQESQQSFERKPEKYFLTKSDIRKVKQLLDCEKNNRFSECFIPENSVLLGIAYELGTVAEKDMLKAEFYYKAGAYNGNLDAKYLYAALMYDKLRLEQIRNHLSKQKDKSTDNQSDEAPETNYKKLLEDCVSQMYEAAENGSVFAMTYFGDAIYDGRYNQPANKELCVSWWKKAAEAGSPVAQYFLAYAFRWGECVEKDAGIALMYALKSMEKEFPRSYRIIGLMYDHGNFVNKDLEQAAKYYRLAVEHGDYLSLVYIGSIYYFDEENYPEAVKYYSKAVEYADRNLISSGLPYYRMGYCYAFGDGVEKDHEKTAEYYLKGAERNHRKSKENAVSYILGIEDSKKKVELLKKASDLRCDNADFRLGMYYKDEGVDKEAIRCFEHGADNGDFWCAYELIMYYSFVIADRKYERLFNQELALRYYRILFSLKTGDIESIEDKEVINALYYSYGIELGTFIPEGADLPDYSLSLYYLKKSVENTRELLNRVVGFAVEGYLFSERSGGRCVQNHKHCLNMLSELDGIIKASINKLLINPYAEKEIGKNTVKLLVSAYDELADIYRKGRYGEAKDKIKSAEMKERADKYNNYLSLIKW